MHVPKLTPVDAHVTAAFSCLPTPSVENIQKYRVFVFPVTVLVPHISVQFIAIRLFIPQGAISFDGLVTTKQGQKEIRCWKVKEDQDRHFGCESCLGSLM